MPGSREYDRMDEWWDEFWGGFLDPLRFVGRGLERLDVATGLSRDRTVPQDAVARRVWKWIEGKDEHGDIPQRRLWNWLDGKPARHELPMDQGMDPRMLMAAMRQMIREEVAAAIPRPLPAPRTEIYDMPPLQRYDDEPPLPGFEEPAPRPAPQGGPYSEEFEVPRRRPGRPRKEA